MPAGKSIYANGLIKAFLAGYEAILDSLIKKKLLGHN
jgi:hypothetical protein